MILTKKTKIVRSVIDKYFPKKIIDGHAHIGEKRHILPKSRETNYTMSSSELLFVYNSLFPDIEVKPVCIPLVKDLVSREDINKYVIDESRKNDFFPVVIYPASKEHINKSIGIKVHPIINGKSIENMLRDEILNKIDKRDKICIVHCPEDASTYIDFLSETCSSYEINFILAHMARCRNHLEKLTKILKKVKNLDNIYFDVSTVSESKIFSKTIETSGYDKILFGTDIPVTLSAAKTLVDKNNKIKIVSQNEDASIINEIYETIIAINMAVKENKEIFWKSITCDNFKYLKIW